MRINNLLFFGILILAGAFQTACYADVREWTTKGWEFLDDKDGIKTFRKSYANSAVKGVGGEALVDASIGKILWVLMDHAHKNQWIDKFKEAETLDKTSPLNQLQFVAFDMPFPVTDREFVFIMHFHVDSALNAVVVDMSSVKDGKAPPVHEGNIRGEILEGRYTLYPRGDKTFVQAEYLADPKGSLPVFLVNFVQKSWPMKTFETLRTQVKKDFVQSWPEFDKDLKPQLKALN
ncbi:MAG: hypothetical protein H7249_04755 [Chitinophagaceae bacterium]|nr:hypothetical protein [Oligoflexus sp.]